MAYDAESDKMILFGGQIYDESGTIQFIGGTWAYDPTANKWAQMEPASSPTDRSAADMTYDAESDRVIMFGGANNSKIGLDETWAFDYNSNSWTEMAKGPMNYLGGRIAYDAESDRTILFAGYDMAGFLYDNTWAYDYNSDTWTEMKPPVSPSGRNYHAMVYDAESDRIIMWGGDSIDADLCVWAYDYNKNAWQKMACEGPVRRDYAYMAYDLKSDRTILYGNENYSDLATWAYDYDTNAWTKLEPEQSPGVLSRFAMAYSPVVDRVILFGGEVNFMTVGQTWSYDLNTNSWTIVMQAQP
jgi:N-acetylneuraminic acid mutarotase